MKATDAANNAGEPASYTFRIDTNRPPVATADSSYEVDEDRALTVTADHGVLDNDSDPDAGDTLKAVKVSGPSHGVLDLKEDGSFTYTPNRDFFGEDSFTYKASDGTAESEPAKVTITVNSVDDAPTFELSGPDAADEGDTETYTYATDDPDGGPAPTITEDCGQNGVLVETEEANHFRCRFPDGPAQSSVSVGADGEAATQLVQVRNVAPVATADAYAIDEDQTLAVPAPEGVLKNDSDVGEDDLEALKASDPSHGTLTLNEDGSFTYAPNPDFFGEDSFTYRASDDTDQSAPVTVRITVKDVRDCTITGTEANDALVGTEGADVICGLGGADTIEGRGGNDTVHADAGNDTVTGGAGKDVLLGGEGNDKIDALDGVSANDAVDGEGGTDTCRRDQGDTKANCEYGN